MSFSKFIFSFFFSAAAGQAGVQSQLSPERKKQSLDKDGLTKTEINFSCFSGILKGPEKNFSMLTKA